MTNEELKGFLAILEIKEDITGVTSRDLNVSFRKLAKVLHPDKAGDEKTAAFQKLLNAYDALKEYLKGKHGVSDKEIFENDYEEQFFKENFERFNFPCENRGSFTVGIEEYLADTWQESLETLLGEPTVKRNPAGTECDRMWKVNHHNSEITIHIYNKPKNKKGSKLMLQGSPQSVICGYVFEELPKVYKIVLENKPMKLRNVSKVGQSTPVRTTVKCDKCQFKSSMVQMKMHIKNIHMKKATRASKRVPAFTPDVKATKRAKPESIIQIVNLTNFDDSVLLSPDEPGTFDANQSG